MRMQSVLAMVDSNVSEDHLIICNNKIHVK